MCRRLVLSNPVHKSILIIFLYTNHVEPSASFCVAEVDIIDAELDVVISTYEFTLGKLLQDLTESKNLPKCVMETLAAKGSVTLMDVDTQKPHSGSPQMVRD